MKLNFASFSHTLHRRANKICPRDLIAFKTFSSSTEVTESSPAGALTDLARAYEPSEVEHKILEKWASRKPSKKKDAPTFRMILPPPNVTGKLHLGHSLTLAVEDTIARWKMMKGYNVDWIPGFDHAGIATHSVVSRKVHMLSQGMHIDMDKELRLFAEDNLSSIKKQLQAMGTLINWDSAYYTLDENHSLVVKEAFVQLFESGLISRSDGIVNWCCTLETSVADVEVDQVDFKGKTTIQVPGCDLPVEFGVLYYCAYEIENSNEIVLVATSRPETMFGDVALAVNPNDSRHVSLIGKKAINPVNNKLLPIISDSRVKTDFGSGVVKITPAHDKLDFAIGQSHNLEKIPVFTTKGLLNENAESMYKGMGRFIARKAVLDHLDKVGALHGSKDYTGSLGLCNRTGDVIELRLLPHWFLHTQNLTEKFLEEISSGRLIICPDNYRQSLVTQLKSSQDWCLSRQIKWGHQIPAYYHKDFSEIWVSAMDINVAKKKLESKLNISINSESEIIQDLDVLDTWFSSALIPLSISGWPDIDELKEISLMETGHDILLFWVWRMAIVSIALMNRLPFNNVLLHGIVTDHYGRKMSKSKGNVIDPMHIVKGISFQSLMEEAKQAVSLGELQKTEYELRIAALEKDYPDGFKTCGTDALRFALLSQDILSESINLDTIYLENCRHFNNKLWQALRFYMIHSNTDPSNDLRGEIVKPNITELVSVADHWLLSCLYEFVEKADSYFDKAQLHLYADSVRKFFYQQLCDTYIEIVKNDMKNGTNKEQHLKVMRYAIANGLKITHPLLPFVTEEIWPYISNSNENTNFMIDQEFPKSKDFVEFHNPKVDEIISKTVRVVKEIRAIKVRTGMKAKTKAQVFLDIPSEGNIDVVKMVKLIETLSNSQVDFGSPQESDKSDYYVVLFPLNEDTCKLYMLRGEKTEAEMILEKEKLLNMQKKLNKLKEQFENPRFLKSASLAAKEKLRKKVEILETQLKLSEFSQLKDETTQSPSKS